MKTDNLKSFALDRFGMFVHWGLYALPAGRWKGRKTDDLGEWLQSYFRIPNKEYHALAKEFNPSGFDAEEWIKILRDTGMRYIVFTAKHHDGFAMFNSKVSDFTVTKCTPWGRDPLEEIASACHKYNIKLGIYYSQALDWDDPDGADPGPDYPKNFTKSWGNDWDYPDFAGKNFDRCLQRKIIPQITELLTEYGPVCNLWCDCPIGIEERHSRMIADHIHKLQPRCVINSRIGHDCGDYGTMGDNIISCSSNSVMQEGCITLNDTWGFKADDHNWKNAETVIEQLLQCAEKGNNMLVNVGPDANGRFTPETIDILHKIGTWHARHGYVLHGSGPSPFPGEIPQAYVLSDGRKLHFFPKKGITENTVISGIISQPAENIPLPVVLQSNTSSADPFPRQTIVFTENPVKVNPIPVPQNGTLALYSCSAELCTENTGENAGEITVNVDGITQFRDAPVNIYPDGSINNWHNQQTFIRWDITLPEGLWQCSCITKQSLHSKEWAGGRTIEVAAGNQVLQKTLTKDIPLPVKYYETAESIIGNFAVNSSYCGTLTVKTLTVGSRENIDMNLEKIILRKID